MKVVYHGHYGAKNSGDDAFIEVASWGTQKYWGCTEHLFFSARIPHILTPVNFFSPHKSYLNFCKAIYEIFNSDIFISAGGSNFHSALKRTDVRSYARIKKKINKKSVIGAIGISLGPYADARAEKDTISYLQQFNFLALRDKQSYNLACTYNLPYKPVEAFDLAALVPAIYADTQHNIASQMLNTEKIIGISICNYEQYLKNGDLNKEKKRNLYFSEILSPLVKQKNIKFRFFIFNGNEVMGDKDVTMELIKVLKLNVSNFEIINYLGDVKKTWLKIKECSLVISTRLHAGIFACFADVPFFLIEYHRKCTDFLNDVGYNYDYRLFDGNKSIKEFADQATKILFEHSYIYPVNKSLTQHKALRNFTHTIKPAQHTL